MLPKKQRLPIRLFRAKKSSTKRGRHFILRIFETEKGILKRASRFGVIVSSKVSKKATKRNALKRSVFSFLAAKTKKLPTADYLVIIQPSAAKLTKNEITKELQSLFK